MWNPIVRLHLVELYLGFDNNIYLSLVVCVVIYASCDKWNFTKPVRGKIVIIEPLFVVEGTVYTVRANSHRRDTSF